MKLLIDDCKDFQGMNIVARDYETGMAILSQWKITELYLDFDLGGEATGLDVLKVGFVAGIIPDLVEIVSLNPVGARQMKHYLEDNGFVEKHPRVFVRN